MATVAEILEDCTAQLSSCLQSGHACPNHAYPERARADAELLLQYALGKNKAWLLTHGSDQLTDHSVSSYREMIARRQLAEPLQYITGEAEFYGLTLGVTPDVLIPRPETEHLVEKAVELGRQLQFPRILDVGTGSGAIAIAIAHALPAAQVSATDLSEDALALARTNADRIGLASRIHFIQADLLKPLTDADEAASPFDIIVSNPPYVPESDRATLDAEVRDYEPSLALFAGHDGLTVYRRLIPEAFAALSEGGWLAMEIGFGQSEAVASLLADAGFRNIAFTPDLQDIPRVATAQRQVESAARVAIEAP